MKKGQRSIVQKITQSILRKGSREKAKEPEWNRHSENMCPRTRVVWAVYGIKSGIKSGKLTAY